MALYQYDPLRVIVTWGEVLLQGFADGTMIMVEFDEDAVTKSVGSQGDVTATINQNRGGKATATLIQGTPTNDLLSARAASNRPRGSSLVVKPLLVKDLQGTSLVIAPQAWIQKVANTEFGKEMANREWVFDFGELKMLTGGSLV